MIVKTLDLVRVPMPKSTRIIRQLILWSWSIFAAALFVFVVLIDDELTEWLAIIAAPSIAVIIATFWLGTRSRWQPNHAEFEFRDADFTCVLDHALSPRSRRRALERRKEYSMRYDDITEVTWTIRPSISTLDIAGHVSILIREYHDGVLEAKPAVRQTLDSEFRVIMPVDEALHQAPEIAKMLGVPMEKVHIIDIRKERAQSR